MESRVTFFDHTADLGIRVTAPDAAQLVPLAVSGMYQAIGNLVAGGPQAFENRTYHGAHLAESIRDLLSDLLTEFEISHRVAAHISVDALNAGRFTVTCAMAPLDEAASELRREVKAVTYHDLRLEQTADGACLEFIVDI